METIVLKIILCSGIVLALYYVFLAKEKTFVFNRFYLLLGLIFSYSIPFVTIEKEIPKEKATVIFQQEIPQQVLQNPGVIKAETFDYMQIVWIIYFVISAILIVKIVFNHKNKNAERKNDHLPKSESCFAGKRYGAIQFFEYDLSF